MHNLETAIHTAQTFLALCYIKLAIMFFGCFDYCECFSLTRRVLRDLTKQPKVP